ncbi:MAG: Rrf2 family transcriptional regulator [Deltaproteobacteria bacterium]|nr:Rrf2 family transcriptional regulator [Deltaproteobacteria bacterium]
MGGCIPLQRSNFRELPRDYRGDVFIWDVDKTYLDSHFSSALDLASFLVEFAVDKQALPGAVPLLHAIRRGAGKGYNETPLYFVSASPPQLKAVIERKMLIDGIEYDGIAFKDQLGHVKKLHLKKLKMHLAYKLAALLEYNRDLPAGSGWYLFGDDAEDDAEIYSLFASIISRELPLPGLVRKLEQYNLSSCEIEELLGLARDAQSGPISLVQGIFIRLTKKHEYGDLTAPGENHFLCRDFLQAALVLAQLGKIQRGALVPVASQVAAAGNRLDVSIKDCLARMLELPDHEKRKLLAPLKEAGLINSLKV